MLDTDNSGTISRAEIKTFFSMNNTTDDKFAYELIDEVDKNGDGEISFPEFKGMMDKFLNKI